MTNFEIALAKTLSKEGVYGNNPDDTGGETYKGIARKKHPNWEGWVIIDKNKGRSSFPACIEQELQPYVKTFYLANFWNPMKLEQVIDEKKASSLFDFGVNAGAAAAITLAQKVVGEITDGIIGPKTIVAINAMDRRLFLAEFTLAKITKYVRIVEVVCYF